MNDYLIYTDSAADMPVHVFEKYDLRIVPMSYSLDGEETLFDTGAPEHDKLCDDFFNALKNGAEAKTTQINPYNYIEIWTPQLKEGNDILYLSFPSGLSGKTWSPRHW